MTVPSRAAYDPGEHLSYGDITFNSQTQPTVAQVNIKASKTDPFRAGVMIYLGRTNCELCPVTALIAYYTIRGTEAGPFFQFRDGSPLSREKMVEKLRQSLTEAGVDPTKFARHSFRIGAASTARANGVQDSMIQTLGWWRVLPTYGMSVFLNRSWPAYLRPLCFMKPVCSVVPMCWTLTMNKIKSCVGIGWSRGCAVVTL